ncbi:VOC family protein [Bauldia sp.]|uniref:VOC family protein n=1 Tax=Bauldia sp. TaxID=2575872 RepID=UPI003BA98737
MSKFTPPNFAVWFEIPVSDMARAKTFYNTVLQTELKEDDTGPNPMAMFVAEDEKSSVAGHLYPGKSSADGTGNTIHLASPDPLEAALDRVRESGGKVISDIFTIPAGRFAYCTDPDGNSIGLFGR